MIEVLNKMSRSFIRPIDSETQENKSGIRKHFLPRSDRAGTIRQAKIPGKLMDFLRDHQSVTGNVIPS
jgi:hypothetical protein